MLCPSCGYDNIDGVDTCENCTEDLTALDAPVADSAIEASIMKESLAALKPKKPIMVGPDTTVAEAVAELCKHNIGCVLVGDADHVQGILSERDVLLRVADRYEQVAGEPVSAYMTPEPQMLDLETPIAFALNRMAIGDFRHVPVTSKGRLVGIISVRDLLSFLSEWYPDLLVAKPTG
jgi:CBS domain-containing protein